MELWNSAKLDLLCLTETWRRPGSSRLTGHAAPNFHTAMPPAGSAHRAFGGAAVISRKKACIRLLHKFTHSNWQAVVVLAPQGAHVVTAHMSPSLTKAEAELCLTKTREVCRGPTVIAGGLNANHSSWSSVTNIMGVLIRSWSLKWGWKTRAPCCSTCISTDRQTAVDLLAAKGLHLAQPYAQCGVWGSESDHLPVIAWMLGKGRGEGIRIPRSLLQSKDVVGDVKFKCDTSLPQMTRAISYCSTPSEVEERHDIIVESLVEPWISHSESRPSRCRFFWGGSLDRMASERTKLHKKRKEADDPELWDKMKKLNKRIKREARATKRRLLRKCSARLSNCPLEEAGKRIKALQKLSRCHSANTDTSAATLDPAAFTLHQAALSRSKVDHCEARLSVGEEFSEGRRVALRRASAGKRPGIDGITNDMLKTAGEHGVQLLAATWKKFGEINYTPTLWRRALLKPLRKKGDQSDPNNYRPIYWAFTREKDYRKSCGPASSQTISDLLATTRIPTKNWSGGCHY